MSQSFASILAVSEDSGGQDASRLDKPRRGGGSRVSWKDDDDYHDHAHKADDDDHDKDHDDDGEDTCFIVARQWSWLEVMVADGRKPEKQIL